MHPHPRRGQTPGDRPAAAVGQIDERLTRVEAVTHEGNRPLHPRLVGRGADPGRVDHEPSGLGVLDERLIQAGIDPVGGGHRGRHVVGDHHLEHPTEKRPRRLTAVDERLDRLVERQPHEGVPRIHGGEDQRPTHPAAAGCRVEEQAHLAEVDLQLHPRLAVGDAHRRASHGPADTELFEGVTVQCPLRNLDATAGQQPVGLDHRQPLVDQPRLELVVMGPQDVPAGAVAVGAVRADQLAHLADQPVCQLSFVAVADQPGLGPGRHVTLDRLAVHQRQPGHGPFALAPHPQAQDFSDLMHLNLPEAHRHLPGPLSVRWRCQPQRRRRWWMLPSGPITGERVAPSCWRNSPRGGPILLAKPTSQWPHAAGGRHLELALPGAAGSSATHHRPPA